ncbi:MAG: glycoside hydrolase family 27 protein, partial [Bacteroidetes bacterium]
MKRKMNISKIIAVWLAVVLGIHGSMAQQKPAAPTPPLGWNSYDCFGSTVTEAEVKANAEMMAVHLKHYGWKYIVIDYCWFYPYPGAQGNPMQHRDFTPNFRMDANGHLLPALRRFPSATGESGFTQLANYVHSMGLKFGIHVMRGIPREAVAKKLPIGFGTITADMIADKNDTCTWLNAMYGVDMTRPRAQEYYNDLFKLYASWGVDYVKVDDIWKHKDEIEAVRKAIDQCGREMVFSISAGDREQIENAEFLKIQADMWRISNDFWDRWADLKNQFELCHLWEKHVGNGHWPDADMIPLGHICQRNCDVRPDRWTRFSRDEQLTLMSLWALAPSPLMLGMNLPDNDDWTKALLTNPEVLAVNQDPPQGCLNCRRPQLRSPRASR